MTEIPTDGRFSKLKPWQKDFVPLARERDAIIVDLYTNHGQTSVEIADRLSISPATACSTLHLYGVKMRTRGRIKGKKYPRKTG